MTTKEKAKAYDEALKVLHKYDGANIMFTQDLKEEMFPELIESEDEKIRKYIVECVEKYGPANAYPERFRKMLAYLEKQGEQKPVTLHLWHGNNEKSTDSNALILYHSTYNNSWNLTAAGFINWGIVDKWVSLSELNNIEQKPVEPNWIHHKVDLSDCSEEYRKAYYDGWNNCNMQHSQCKLELDDVLKCLINGMKFYYEDNKDATWGTDKWSMPVKHIIEVLEKQGEQKPVEEIKGNNGKISPNLKWSEEDEKYMNALIDKLETLNFYNDSFSIGGYSVYIIANWLKSLRSQKLSNMERIGNDWKPSEEQLEALRVAKVYPSSERREILETLYADLEQLKAL